MPEFPGGHREFVRFISHNIEYLDVAREYGIEGTVYVSFVVETDGSITQVKVLRGIFKPLDEEAVRVVKMMPVWKPGKQKGKPVRVRYKVPISFAFK
jgi:protein TonB